MFRNQEERILNLYLRQRLLPLRKRCRRQAADPIAAEVAGRGAVRRSSLKQRDILLTATGNDEDSMGNKSLVHFP